MSRYLLKIVCFLFLTKCARKDDIIPFGKATRNKIFNVGDYMRKTQLGCWQLKRRTKMQINSSGA
jgi:hypothetical protein